MFQSQKAISDYTTAIQIDPAYTKAYYNRGVSYAWLNSHPAAILEFSKAIELDPEYALAYCERAMSYKQLGCLDLAQQDLVDYRTRTR